MPIRRPSVLLVSKPNVALQTFIPSSSATLLTALWTDRLRVGPLDQRALDQQKFLSQNWLKFILNILNTKINKFKKKI